MTPEAGDYLAKARHALAEARAVMGIGLANAADRAAYLAAYTMPLKPISSPGPAKRRRPIAAFAASFPGSQRMTRGLTEVF